MINNVVIGIFLVIILITHWRKRPDLTFVTSFIYLTCAPLIQFGSRSVNNLYALTPALALLAVIDLIRLRPPLFRRRTMNLYVICMGVVLLSYGIGYLMNGTASIPTAALAMAGEVMVMATVILMARLLYRLKLAQVQRAVLTGIAIFVGINTAMVLFQKLFFVPSYRLMDAFYVSDSRFKPLFVMWKTGAFDRVMGTFFTPVVLGTTMLLAAAVLTAYILNRRFRRAQIGALVMIMLMTAGGILAFSKTYMLGLPILLGIAFLLILFNKKDRAGRLRKWLVILAASAAVYVLIYVLLPPDMVKVRNYYYGYLINPFGALSSRYQGIAEPAVNQISDAARNAEEQGITARAFDFFLKHPVFGVGAAPVAGEFLGDSQVMFTLHSGGVAGALGYTAFFGIQFVRSLRDRHLFSILIIAVVAMCCVSAAMLTLPSTIPFLAVMIRMGDEGPFSTFTKSAEIGRISDK